MSKRDAIEAGEKAFFPGALMSGLLVDRVRFQGSYLNEDEQTIA